MRRIGNAAGAMYVREYFDEGARQTAIKMVKDFSDVFTHIVDEIEWMDEKSRVRDREGRCHYYSLLILST